MKQHPKPDYTLHQLRQGAKEIHARDAEIKNLKATIDRYAKHAVNYVVEQARYNNTLRFAMISDTHLGSLYERQDALLEFIDVCRREKITDIFHAGDILDGWGIYKGQEFELYARGFDEQMKVLHKVARATRGMTIHFITGNHDTSFKKLIGIDVGGKIMTEEPNWRYMGEDYGSVVLKTRDGRKFRLAMIHPDGGTAYALSYKLQKTIESLSGGTKPNILGMGHYHKSEHLPSYRNVEGLQAGCFQAQTPLMKRKHSPAHLGGWIITVTVGKPEHLSNRFNTEFIAFYEKDPQHVTA